MTFVKWSMVVYGLANIVMGAEAAIRVGSWISLAAGGGAGLIVLAMAWLSFTKPRPAYIVTLVVAVGLLGRFLPTVISKQQVYPAMVSVALSAAIIAVLLGGHLADMKAKAHQS